MHRIPEASHLFFAPISATNGRDATRQMEMCRSRMAEVRFKSPFPARVVMGADTDICCYLKFGFDYLGTFFIGHREMHRTVQVHLSLAAASH
jgi:hypothetical protein